VRAGRLPGTTAAAARERAMTATLVTRARPIEARLRPLYATGFIHGFARWYSMLSACIARFASLQLVPTALGFGLVSRAHGIFEASAFVVGALGVMCLTLSVIVVRRR
jgi:hypothetical protein